MIVRLPYIVLVYKPAVKSELSLATANEIQRMRVKFSDSE